MAHEALIRAWPTFAEWISANRVDLLFQLQLGEAAQAWVQSDASPDFLWSGLRLANADAWLERAQPALNTRDQSFLAASRATARARAAAEEADRRERETLLQARAEADRRNVSRLRLFLALGSVLLVVALALLGYAINRQQKESEARAAAEHQTHIAESQARAAEALFDLTNGDPERALLLARAALLTDTQSYAPIVFRALHRTLEDTVSRQRLSSYTDLAAGASWSQDETRVLTWSSDTTAQIWDVASGTAVQVLKGHTGWVTGATWSKDETRVLTWSEDQTARIWDVASGKTVQVLEGHTDAVRDAVWSQDEQRVLTFGDKTARIWDAATGKAMQVLEGHTGSVVGAVWSQDEQRVLTWSADGTARVWVVEPRLLAAELTNRVCHVFSDAEISKLIPSWRGSKVELAAVDADLQAYKKFWQPR